ncbi:Nuclear RNA export factor 1 [Zootermopsis nevadensis]|uniref:Nuclear RNA export factor 1 n=1 Tax=Zootermopsis nevadensis TaxID=136037 RepID=A0A067QF23_ZOONE|nr:Nuclear RNA export factor 1 [Zootermopsis nevadensis]
MDSGDRRILKRLRRSVPLVLGLEKSIRKAAMWFQVTIHHGGNYRKNYVLRNVMANVGPTEFIPICYRVTGRNSSFFVDDCNAAEKLASLKDEIAIRGQTLLVEVRPGLPQVVTDSTAMERIKTVIARRHDATSKSLDLSRLHTDADLVDNFSVALFVPSMMLAVVDVVAKNFPDLEALDLSENKLYLIENLSALPSKLPNLKVLRLGRNLIPEMRKLEGLPLEELVLAENPLTSNIYSKALSAFRGCLLGF